MKIIGINGNPGSGKTTASNIMFKDKKTMIIHLDDIFDGIKELLPKRNVNTFKKDTEFAIIINRNSLLYKTISLKYINKQLQLAKKIYANKMLKKYIKHAYDEGIEYFIIEGVHLENYDITYLIDYLIFIKADINDRIDRIIKRDGEFSNVIFNKSLNAVNHISLENYDFIIDNISSKEDFKEKCYDIEKSIRKEQIKVKRKIK